MPTVGVAPGTFTISLGACPQDPKGWYMTDPLGPPLAPVADTAGGYLSTMSPYANEAALRGGLRGPRTVFGLRTDIFGVVFGGIVLTGVVVGLLVSK